MKLLDTDDPKARKFFAQVAADMATVQENLTRLMEEAREKLDKAWDGNAEAWASRDAINARLNGLHTLNEMMVFLWEELAEIEADGVQEDEIADLKVIRKELRALNEAYRDGVDPSAFARALQGYRDGVDSLSPGAAPGVLLAGIIVIFIAAAEGKNARTFNMFNDPLGMDAMDRFYNESADDIYNDIKNAVAGFLNAVLKLPAHVLEDLVDALDFRQALFAETASDLHELADLMAAQKPGHEVDGLSGILKIEKGDLPDR